MNQSDLPEVPALRLVCPRCRVRTPQGLRVSTLTRQGAVLQCAQRSCQARYPAEPIIAVFRDFGAIAGPLTLTPWHRLDPEASVAWLQALAPDAAPSVAARRMATYVWAHFRDLMPAELTPSFVQEPPLPVLLAAMLPGPWQTALVMGAGAGRLPLELAARGAKLVVSLDLDPMFVAWSNELAAATPRTLPLPEGAVHWGNTCFTLPERLVQASRIVVPICADALDSPLPHRSFDLVVLPNLLDNVADPLTLLFEATSLLTPGGTLVVASPFAWQRNVTPPPARLEARTWIDDSGEGLRLDGPEALVGLLTGKLRSPHAWRLEHRRSETFIWHLRYHARQFNTFACEVLEFRNTDARPHCKPTQASCSGG